VIKLAKRRFKISILPLLFYLLLDAGCSNHKLSADPGTIFSFFSEFEHVEMMSNRDFPNGMRNFRSLQPNTFKLISEYLGEAAQANINTHNSNRLKFPFSFRYTYMLTVNDDKNPIYGAFISRTSAWNDDKLVDTDAELTMRAYGCEANGVSAQDVINRFGHHPIIIVKGRPEKKDYVPLVESYIKAPVKGCFTFNEDNTYSNYIVKYDISHNNIMKTITFSFNGFGKLSHAAIATQHHIN